MNVQRFTGRDNRAALDQVRQHLGPDALVLSSRRTGDVLEICATDGLPDLSKAESDQVKPSLVVAGAGL